MIVMLVMILGWIDLAPLDPRSVHGPPAMLLRCCQLTAFVGPTVVRNQLAGSHPAFGRYHLMKKRTPFLECALKVMVGRAGLISLRSIREECGPRRGRCG